MVLNSFTAEDEVWMRAALALAQEAQAHGEVPVGAIIVQQGVKLGAGYNQPIAAHDPTAHAEIIAIREAGKTLGNYRLSGATLYATLEPCTMCAGAIIHARIKRLVFAATDPRTGAAGSVFDSLLDVRHNHRVVVQGGLLADVSANLLREFFQQRRKAPSR